jgi:hypothetical protein
MSQNIHLTEIYKSLSDAIATLGNYQSGLITDTYKELIWREGSNFYLGMPNRYTTNGVTFTYQDALFANYLTPNSGYVGLGASAGRLEFTDAATDLITVKSADLILDTGCKLGVGTAVPGGAVEIAGSLGLRLSRAGYASTMFGDFWYDITALNIASKEGIITLGKGDISSFTPYLNIIDTGKVGILTAAPGCALCINGGVSIGDNAATADNNLHVVGAVDIGTTLTMGGNILLNGHYLSNDGGNEGISVDNSGNVTASGTVKLTGSLAATADLQLLAASTSSMLKLMTSDGPRAARWDLDAPVNLTNPGDSIAYFTPATYEFGTIWLDCRIYDEFDFMWGAQVMKADYYKNSSNIINITKTIVFYSGTGNTEGVDVLDIGPNGSIDLQNGCSAHKIQVRGRIERNVAVA